MSSRKWPLLFVYGTLRSETNTPMAQLLQQHSNGLEKAVMRGKLYDAGSFPAAVHNQESPNLIHGSLHTVSNSEILFKRLDRYEGYHSHDPGGSLFVRKKVPIIKNGQSVIASTYLFNQSTSKLKCITSGDYLAYCNKN